jgi:hypothetical protein
LIFVLVIIFLASIIQRTTASNLKKKLKQADNVPDTLYWREVFRSAISLQNFQAGNLTGDFI